MKRKRLCRVERGRRRRGREERVMIEKKLFPLVVANELEPRVLEARCRNTLMMNGLSARFLDLRSSTKIALKLF